MQQKLTEDKSIYLQISQMIETDILRGILLEEERVPSTNELAKLYTINPATAAKGVNLLVDEGILYKKRGIGMFVSTGAAEKIRSRRKQEFYEVRLAELLAGPMSDASMMQTIDEIAAVIRPETPMEGERWGCPPE